MTAPLLLIPARLAATRLPNKPLADIHGLPMIVQVMKRAQESGLGRVVVAAGDAPIVDAITAAGGEAVLTDPALPSGSDRIYAALQIIDPQKKHDVIINVQGDLPTLDPRLIRDAAALLNDPAVDIGTLAAVIRSAAERDATHVVKAIADIDIAGGQKTGRALYFSRAVAPSGEGPYLHHIGLYAYRRSALERFVTAAPSVLEKREKLEQLRALSLGLRIEVAVVDTVPLGVDTPEDLEKARALLKT